MYSRSGNIQYPHNQCRSKWNKRLKEIAIPGSHCTCTADGELEGGFESFPDELLIVGDVVKGADVGNAEGVLDGVANGYLEAETNGLLEGNWDAFLDEEADGFIDGMP